MDTLRSSEGKAIGLSYFVERGFREDTILRFQLGYSRDDRNAFSRTAIDKGYKTDFLVKTGLSIERENQFFDRFHGRVIFPIHGLTGQVLGFAGRVMRSDEKTAKYLNSPESDIYHKSDILYGLYFARQSILKNDKCYLVEGYTDVISMHQSGIDNVVSSSGTSLTVNQIRLIKRFTHNITILYDGDEAGIKASLRGIDLLLEEGLNVRVVLLPDGEDPDSFARKNSADTTMAFIAAHEADFISFKTSLLRKDAETDPIKRANLITEIVRTISVIPESITRSVYIRECSKLLEIDEKILYTETARLRAGKLDQRVKQADVREYAPIPVTEAMPGAVAQPVGYPAEQEVIRLLLMFGDKMISLHPTQEDSGDIRVANYICHEIEQDELEFHHPVLHIIYTEIASQMKENELKTDEYFIRHGDESVSKIVVDLITSEYDLSKIWKRRENFLESEDMKLNETVPEAILALKNEKVIKLIREAEVDLQHAQEQNDTERIQTLQVKFMVLNSLKMNLSKGLGDRIILHTSS
jgi:DNA primase